MWLKMKKQEIIDKKNGQGKNWQIREKKHKRNECGKDA